jgi:hypothetical protein
MLRSHENILGSVRRQELPSVAVHEKYPHPSSYAGVLYLGREGLLVNGLFRLATKMPTE